MYNKYILYTIYYILYTIYYILYTIYYILYIYIYIYIYISLIHFWCGTQSLMLVTTQQSSAEHDLQTEIYNPSILCAFVSKLESVYLF